MVRKQWWFSRAFFFLAAIFSVACPAWSGEQRASVLTSIRPLALLVQDVAGDAADVEVLLPSGASPHHYALRVSDMRNLKAADLLVWMGPEFERFLADMTVSRDPQSQLVLETLPGLSWPSLKASGQHEAEHGHSGKDMHLWLNPDNGRVVMRAVAKRLSELVPEKAEVFTANLARAESALDQTTEQLEQRFDGLSQRAFGVSHDAFAHFVERFDLTQAAAISAMPDQGLSARHVAQTVAALKGAQCLIVEEGEAESSVQRVQRLVNLPVVAADPLAVDPEIDSYAAFIAKIGASFAECLAGSTR
jgi:zinc transport system substrate-binding protein